MITIKLIISLLAIHLFADYLLQSMWQRTNKHKVWSALLSHSSINAACWFVAAMFIFKDSDKCVQFSYLTFIFHTITDYTSSRINHAIRNENRYWFYLCMGVDQFLHLSQIFLTYFYLSA